MEAWTSPSEARAGRAAAVRGSAAGTTRCHAPVAARPSEVSRLRVHGRVRAARIPRRLRPGRSPQAVVSITPPGSVTVITRSRGWMARRGTRGFLRGRSRGRRRRRRQGSRPHLDFPRRSGLAQRANGPTGRRTRRAARASHPAGPGNAGARTVAAAAAAPQAAGGRTRDEAVLPSSARSCVARGGPCDDPGRIGGARLRISDADGHDRGAGSASAAIPRRASAPATVRGHRTRSAGHTAGRRPIVNRRRTPGEPSGKGDDAFLAHAGAPGAAPRAPDCAGPHAPPHGQGPAPRKPRAKTGPTAIRMGGWRAGEDSNPRPSDS